MQPGPFPLTLTILMVALSAFCFAADDREVIFQDDFNSYTTPDGHAAKWAPFGGKWSIEESTLQQSMATYDCGIAVKGLYLECDYRIEAKVQLVSDGGGAGFYWNVGNPETGENSDMLRFDGLGPMMYGYMYRKLFVRTGAPEGSLADNEWHTMRLDVINSKGTCDFYWDGEKTIDGMKFRYRAGYPALETSLGAHRFDDVKITVAKGTEWKSTPKYEVKPEISDVTADSAVITWKTKQKRPTRVWLVDRPFKDMAFHNAEYGSAKSYGDGKMETAHRAKLAGLKPGREYTFAIAPTKEAISPEGFAVDYRFVTKAPKGMMLYREVPLAVLCYMHVTHENEKKPDGSPAEPTLYDQEWYESRSNHAEAMRYFYLINTMFHLDTKCHYYKVTRPVDFSQLTIMTETVGKDLAALAEREGLEAEDFGAVLVVGAAGTYAYPWPSPWWDGSLDYTTGCCFVGWGDTWINVHEFHHLTEGWMSQMGFPICEEGGYGHADRPWHHPGRFGQSYDFLTHTMRYVPPETYLKLSVGWLKTTADKDQDGVPDDEPNIIFDEKRGETKPTTKYSYGNGLTDLQNLTAESLHPAPKGHKHPMLTKEIDLKYPFAVFSYDYERKKKSPKIDGKLQKGEWDEFTSSPNATNPRDPKLPWGKAYPTGEGEDYRMQTYLNWDDDYLYFAAKAPYKFLAAPEIDGQADGYFSGKDNIHVGVEIPRDESRAKPYEVQTSPGVMVWNNVEPVEENDMPVWTNEMYDQREKCKWAWGKDDEGWYVLEMAIAKCPKLDFEPKAGQEIGLRPWFQGFLPPTEGKPDPRYSFEMFEACEYGYFKLVE